jgi:hypothetical protein
MQKHLNLDHDQQLAFQIGTAAYFLTYFEDAVEMEASFLRKEGGGSIRGQMRHDFIEEKAKLKKLARLSTNTSLRMILD